MIRAFGDTLDELLAVGNLEEILDVVDDMAVRFLEGGALMNSWRICNVL